MAATPRKLDPDTTPAMRALRLYATLLFTGKRWFLTELAEKFQCSKQTIQRQITQLQASGELRVDQGFEGNRLWYRVVPPPQKPNVTLTPEELQHLLLCRDLVSHLLPKEQQDEIERTVHRATALLASPGGRTAATTSIAEARPRGTIDYSRFQGILADVSRAITERKVCRVTCHAPYNAEPKTYWIAPLKLIAHSDTLYVKCRLAWEDGEAKPDLDPMLLAVQRLQNVVVGDRAHAATDDVPDEPRAFGLMDGKPFRATIRVTGWAATYVAERVWSEGQTLRREPDGSVVLEFLVTSELEVVSFVLGFGPEAKVLKPLRLAKQVIRNLWLCLDRYEEAATR
ncbi:MAG: helix-turn-helix transcriptional regulator [Coriobacteriia bacterium]